MCEGLHVIHRVQQKVYPNRLGPRDEKLKGTHVRLCPVKKKIMVSVGTHLVHTLDYCSLPYITKWVITHRQNCMLDPLYVAGQMVKFSVIEISIEIKGHLLLNYYRPSFKWVLTYK